MPGYDGVYVVSRDGEVYSLHNAKPEPMAQQASPWGPRVCLWRNGKRSMPCVHKIVERAFSTATWHPDAELAWYIREQYWSHPEVRDWFARELGNEPAEVEELAPTPYMAMC